MIPCDRRSYQHFTYLNVPVESAMAPTIILAMNQGTLIIRGMDDIVSLHGIPIDLLDRYILPLSAILFCKCTDNISNRCMVIKMEGYTSDKWARMYSSEWWWKVSSSVREFCNCWQWQGENHP